MSDDGWAFRDRCSIVGVGSTDYSRHSGRTELSLAVEAARVALADAGLSPRDVDGIICSDVDVVTPYSLASAIGADGLAYWGQVGPGGVAPPAMVGQAVAAVAGGLADVVVGVRALNGRSGRRFGAAVANRADGEVGGDGTFYEYVMPYGVLTPAHTFGLMARRHMAQYGTSSEDLASVALICRARANANPGAQMHERTLTLKEFFASRVIADPLRLFDCCLETDGACAFVVTSTQRARDLAKPPVLIRSVASGAKAGVVGGPRYASLFNGDISTTSASVVADRLYARAELTPADIDVAQLYDCFTISVIVQLEDYGFCKKGQGGPFASSGAIDLGGELPINTGGGHLSEGYLHGMNHVVEGVRQIRGESTAQAPRPVQNCLVTASPLPVSSALILSGAA